MANEPNTLDEGNKKETHNTPHGEMPVDWNTQQFVSPDGNSNGGSESTEDTQPLDMFSGMDWSTLLKEHAIAENQFAELVEQNKKQIAEAEAQLGEKASSIYDIYGELYDLDPNILKKASEEELQELIDAIESKQDIETVTIYYEGLKEKLNKEKWELIDWASTELYGIWASKMHPKIDEYELLKDSIPKKIDFYETELSSGNSIWPDFILAEYPKKIKALKEWEEKYKKFLKLEEQSQEAEENSPKAGLLEGKNAIIAKFQDQNSLYSQKRKNNAVWCKSYEEAKKNFSALSKKQREQMTFEQINSLTSYTGSGSATINRPLNAIGHSSGWGVEGKKIAYNQAVLMTEALDNCISDRDVWLQRGVSELHFGGLDFSEVIDGKVPLQSIIGKEFINNSFMSCGTAKGSGFAGHALIMNIYCPRGTKMHYVNDISHYKGAGENETIINRGYHFVVRKAEKVNGHFYIDVDLIVGSDYDRLTNEQMKKLYNKYL